MIGHPLTDPKDGRQRCPTCHKYVWLVIHSCTGVPADEHVQRKPKEDGDQS